MHAITLKLNIEYDDEQLERARAAARALDITAQGGAQETYTPEQAYAALINGAPPEDALKAWPPDAALCGGWCVEDIQWGPLLDADGDEL